MSIIATVRILDWRKAPYFGVDEFPIIDFIDIPNIEKKKFEAEFNHYRAEQKFNGPRHAKAKHGYLVMTKIKANREQLGELRRTINLVVAESYAPAQLEGREYYVAKNAFLYSIVNRHYSLVNKIIIKVFNELNLDVTYKAMAEFLNKENGEA